MRVKLYKALPCFQLQAAVQLRIFVDKTADLDKLSDGSFSCQVT